MLNSLATLYWRILGNATEAVTCAKLAYQYAPKTAKVGRNTAIDVEMVIKTFMLRESVMYLENFVYGGVQFVTGVFTVTGVLFVCFRTFRC